MCSAWVVVNNCEPAVLFQAGTHLAIKINSVGDVMGGVTKKCQVNRILRQHWIVLTRDNRHDVVQAFLVRPFLEIAEAIGSHVHCVHLTVRRHRFGEAPGEIAVPSARFDTTAAGPDSAAASVPDDARTRSRRRKKLATQASRAWR